MNAYFVLALVPMALCVANSNSWQRTGVSECESEDSDWFHCWESNVMEGTCTGEPNSAWIRNTEVCNGLVDCPNGEDESIVHCKREPSELQAWYFYCATGAVLELSKKCDGKVDCSDGSDEMPTMCQPAMKKPRWRTCNKDGLFLCRPGKCAPAKSDCDGKYDCRNGFDESIEVCYQQWHNETQFQCGNGRIIATELTCNGVHDCIDGSDELSNVCGTDTAPNKCVEPPAPLSFTLDTKYHRGVRGTKYVLPNEVVKVQCIPSHRFADSLRTEWNVCEANGQWAFRWPICIRSKYWEN
ncbi:very low-density lipoprotein receptor-like [Drosophila obscura]|uniref:very low-density lipoprotein receptor-like n=1 Tax=Drosophila obscura TaxID=7282 RepID=UPI001BB15DB8|nr:very low-density lipoprotein receptor-like [Drosophila obscura]